MRAAADAAALQARHARLFPRESPNCLTRRDPLIPLRPVPRQLGDAARLHQAGPGFGRRFRARGSHRPGRLPTRWYATAFSIASIQPRALLRPRRLELRGERRQGLLGPLEAHLRVAPQPFSLAATAMTVRSRLYASR